MVFVRMPQTGASDRPNVTIVGETRLLVSVSQRSEVRVGVCVGMVVTERAWILGGHPIFVCGFCARSYVLSMCGF